MFLFKFQKKKKKKSYADQGTLQGAETQGTILLFHENSFHIQFINS